MSQITALIAAAGRGERFGGDTPKQFRLLAGKPIIAHTVDAFLAHPRISRCLVVADPEAMTAMEQALAGREVSFCTGGATRQQSVRRGLEALATDPPEIVLVQDGARPRTSAALIDRVIAALESRDGAADGVLPVLPVTDSLKRLQGDTLTNVDRVGLFHAQTPQGFRYVALLRAHRAAANADFTDDAAVAEAAGLRIVSVEGDAENLKVTQPDDLARIEALHSGQQETRIGTGFDVHRFAPGDGLVLCGVSLPFDRKLAGHSDADVGLHALTDALLGTIAAGDIGDHFPPSDPRWKDAESGQFLRHAADLVRRRGGRIINVDLTLICERPRLGPHKAAMKERIATLLDLTPDAVSLKATTTERLGFTGREEGIAAQAAVSVQAPR